MAFDPNDPDTKAALDAIRSDFDAKLETEQGKNRGLLDDFKKAQAALRAKEGVNPDDLAKVEADRDRLANELAAATKTAKDAALAIDKANKALEQEQGFTQRLLIQDGIKSALIANGVKDEDFLDTLALKFANGATVKIDGDNRLAQIGDKTVADAIKEWAGSDSGKKFVSAPDNSGGGASGGGGVQGGKTTTRSAFDAMEPAAKTAFAKDGGKVVD